MLGKEWLAYVLLLFLAGCRNEMVYDVPQEIEPYVQRFIAEAAQRHIYIRAKDLVISFEENIMDEAGNRANGKCIRSFLNVNPPHITLDTTLGWWNAITNTSHRIPDIYEINRPVTGLLLKDSVDLSRERVIFHELAHGLLNREHRQDTLPNGYAASLMAKSAPATYVHNPQYRSYYMDELFNPEISVPCWAQHASGTHFPIETGDSLLLAFSQGAFTNVMVNSAGEIWLSGPRGLCQYQEKNKYILYDRTNSSFPGNAALFRTDKLGTVWVLTQSQQLLYQQGKEFISFPLQALPQLLINDFIFDSHNTLWLATDQGLIHYIIGNTFRIYDANHTNLPDKNILNVDIDKNNRVWIMYGNGGIAMLQTENNFLLQGEVTYHPTGIFSGNSTFVVVDKNNTVWTLTNKGDLFTRNHAAGSFVRVDVLDCAYPDVFVTALQTDASGNVWIGYIKGTDVGVARQEKNGLFTAYPVSYRKQLKHMHVTNENELIHEIQFDPAGTIWIAGTSGIIKVPVSAKTQ